MGCGASSGAKGEGETAPSTPEQSLPATLDEVDAQFVTSALRREGYIQANTRIVSLEKIKFGREKGYLGDKCLVKDVVYEPLPAAGPEAPASVFVKMFPTDLVIPAASCVTMWHMEVNFVTRMLKDLPDAKDFRVPRFYFTEFRESEAKEGGSEPPRFVILMEHISNAKPFDILTAMPLEHALCTAKDLAILHAPYWGWTHARYREETDQSGRKRFEGCGHIEDAGKKQSIQGLFGMGAKMGLEVFGPESGALSAEQLENFAGYVEFWRFWAEDVWPLLQKRWGALFARWSSMPTTLIHGDLHVENMFCLADGTNCYIDFQAVNLGPGVRDLAWLLASSLTSKDRRDHERTIVNVYHDALLARGVSSAEYSSEQCWADFVFMKLHGLYAGVLGAGLFAGKNFQAKAGIFAAEPSADAVLERERNSALFTRVVDDLRHSKWAGMLGSMAEDAET
mmetsp:Transcript_95638/g.279680  ORF Transcript_95638/g.279680 Transcript_95638/m.279680 type:complete len:453 (+) Transcript_95638:29-1387(+)